MSKKISYADIGLPNKIFYKRNNIKDWKGSNVVDSELDEWIRKRSNMEE